MGEKSNDWTFYDPSKTSSYSVKDNGKTVTVQSGANTDWWSTAVGSVPESDAHRSSGPVAHRTLQCDANSNWKLSAWLSQKGKERFQQTTLFVKLGEKWLKSGIENEDDMQYIGAVSTNPYSDWCLTPRPKDHDRVWIEVHKHGADLIIRYSFDGKQTYLLREVKGFCPEQEPQHWWLGVMVCGPMSQSTSGTVTDFSISES